MHAVFFLLVAAGASFVWWSSGALPAVVASHFDSAGNANGFMPREPFTAFMLAIVVLVPTFLYSLGWLTARIPVRFVNLPNKQYWLAPERSEATLRSIARFGVWTAYATLALLCAVHWLVVRANTQHPPRLESAPMVAAVAVYFVALAIGMFAVLGRFFRGR